MAGNVRFLLVGLKRVVVITLTNVFRPLIWLSENHSSRSTFTLILHLIGRSVFSPEIF